MQQWEVRNRVLIGLESGVGSFVRVATARYFAEYPGTNESLIDPGFFQSPYSSDRLARRLVEVAVQNVVGEFSIAQQLRDGLERLLEQ